MDGLVLIAPRLEGFLALDQGDAAGLTFWKELIYCGQFSKGEGPAQQRFTVTPDRHEPELGVFSLAHWERESRRMLDNGISIPMPIEHTTDPTRNRAEIVGVVRKPNKLGVMSLYGKVQFPDTETARNLKSAGVSIFVPRQFTDGLSRRYEFPITHVAFTNSPVIPGLEKFKAIAASFVEESATKGVLQMSKISDYAASIGLPVDGRSDDELVDAIKGIIEQLQNDLNAVGEGAGADGSGGDAGEGAGGGASDTSPDDATSRNGGDAAKKADDEEQAAVAASLVPLIRENRQMKLSRLLETGRITPAVHKTMADQYCSDTVLALSIKPSGKSSITEFDRIVGMLEANEPVLSFKDKTPGQYLALSKDRGGDGSQDALVKNAEQRAAASRRN